MVVVISSKLKERRKESRDRPNITSSRMMLRSGLRVQSGYWGKVEPARITKRWSKRWSRADRPTPPKLDFDRRGRVPTRRGRSLAPSTTAEG